MHGVSSELRALVQRGVEARGFDLVEVELGGGRDHPTLRVYIDCPGGVTVDDCAEVSRQLSALLDVEDPLPGGYTLEVSSPGLDRPLVSPDDFRRFAGVEVKIRLRVPLAGRRNFTGRLLGIESGQVAVESETAAGGGVKEIVRFTLDDIERARLVPQI